MARPVVPGVSRLTTARARVDLTHHGAVGLFGRPRLDLTTIRTANGIWSLHETLSPPVSRRTLAYVFKWRKVRVRHISAVRREKALRSYG